jgi:Erv1 / Alr family
MSAYDWGPSYWFFLHTLAHNYPLQPNSITRQKYYSLIQNMPLFIPDLEMADNFQSLLNRYPVTPYLGNRENFARWMHFVHNEINAQINKPRLPFYESMDIFQDKYDGGGNRSTQKKKEKRNVLTAICIVFSLLFFFLFSDNESIK